MVSPYSEEIIEISGYSDIWGVYSDNLICRVSSYIHTRCSASFGPRREKTCLQGFVNNTGADQLAHPRSLISAFVIRVLESIICTLATGKISIF